VPATVSYDPARNRATLQPRAALAGEAPYQAVLSAGITDHGGNAVAPHTWSFTTGKAAPRLAGSDRYGTAAAVSSSMFGPGVPVAYVATGADFPDALAGAPAARVGNGPLLLVAPNLVPHPTAMELHRLRPGRIVVLGGTGAVSAEVLDSLRSYTSGAVTRVSGADRFATAASISAVTFATGPSVVFVTTGRNYPDALAAGAEAARQRAPILLVETDSVPDATADELARLQPSRIVVVGGPGAVSESVLTSLRSHAPTVERISGADRYATAVALSRTAHAANGPATVYIATGEAYPDGLSAGPVAGARSAPLLLVAPAWLPPSVAVELRRLDPTNIVFVGGPAAITDALRDQIRALWP
jgi:putative cell wall-binding protein